MFNPKKCALYALLAACLPAYANGPAAASQPVQAAPRPAVPGPGKEAAEIAAINERLAVMTARLAELEMQAKIAAKKSEISKVNSSSSVDDSFIPSVHEISGIDGRIWAVLNVQSGNTQTVRVGDKVGAWRVTDIRADSVTVRKGGETLRLSFGLNTIQSQAALQPNGTPVGGLPPYPVR